MLPRDATLYLCCVLIDMMTGLVSFTVARRAGDMGVEAAMLGVIGGAFFISYAPLAPLAGMLSDRLSRRRLMLPACGVCGLAILALMRVTAPWAVAAAMALFGVGMAMFWPPMVAWIAEGKSGRRLARSLALYSLAWNIGVLLGNAFGGILYVTAVPLQEMPSEITVPESLAAKAKYDPETGRLQLSGTMKDADVERLAVLSSEPSFRRAVDQLVYRSRHRPAPLVLAAFLPVLVALLLLLPSRPTKAVKDGNGMKESTSPPAANAFTRNPEDGTDASSPSRAQGLPLVVYLWTAWLACFATTFSGKGLQALFPKLADALDVPAGVHGLLGASARAAAVVTFLLMQVSFVWHRRLWPLWLTQALLALGMLIVASSSAVPAFFAAFVLNGVASGYCFYASVYYSMEFYAANRKGRGSGLTEGIIGSGLLLGPLAAGLAGHLLGARAPYYFLAVAVAVLIGLNGLLVRWSKQNRSRLA